METTKNSARRKLPSNSVGCRRLKFCGSFAFLFGAVVLSWCLYLASVLWMAVGVHRLDPTLQHTGNRSKEAGGSRDLQSIHHVANNHPQLQRDEGLHQSTESAKQTSSQQVVITKYNGTIRTPTTRQDIDAIIEEQIRQATGTKAKRRAFKANPFGHMVQPETFLQPKSSRSFDDTSSFVPPDQILSAYLEPIDQSQWTVQPLPVRKMTAQDLTLRQYPKLNSCSRLPEQWPVDDYPDDDPFLPWIHDVFPTEDGKFIQFIAQNKRRCHTGTTPEETAILEWTAPQVALFQHVPLQVNGSTYRLSSHAEADIQATRFICRFKPSGEITFSEFNNDYEWVGFRKKMRKMFTEEGRDNKQIHTSQLLFKCPVPSALVETVRNGDSVVNDWATLFVDVIPIRTPPRYGPPEEFLVPDYAEELTDHDSVGSFDPIKAWGNAHVLPALHDSGRWENIPICKPSLQTYEPDLVKSTNAQDPIKHHHLVSCLWTSAGYATRGNRYAINDGQRRLVEWITYHKMLGFDHFYIYDNSGAFSNEFSLQPVEDLFPNDITLIQWPSRVCNNNPNNVDSVGERSSQYAAESSCRLRFGPHVNWIGQFDVDEYLVPMGNYTSILPLLEKLDQENNKIISFASWRAWPRMTHINPPSPIVNKTLCGKDHPCFELSVRSDTTFLEAYNCDRQLPGQKKRVMPAEKQIYRPDYVTQHFIHYSTVTQTTNLKKNEFNRIFGNQRLFPDPLSRFVDEVNEGLMLHSKAVARQDTVGWEINCHANHTQDAFDLCRLGIPWPDNQNENDNSSPHNNDGWLYNCYVNKRIDSFWGPKLKSKLKEAGLVG